MNEFLISLWFALQMGNPFISVKEIPNGDIFIEASVQRYYQYCLQESKDLITWHETSLGCIIGTGRRENVTLYRNPGEKSSYFRIIWTFYQPKIEEQ